MLGEGKRDPQASLPNARIHMNYIDAAKLTSGTKERGRYNELLLVSILFFQYGVATFNYTFRTLVGNTYKIDTLVMYAVLAIVFVLAFRDILLSISLRQVGLIVLLFAVIGISSLFSKNIELTQQVAGNILANCIPIYLVASSVKNFDRLWSYLKRGAYFAIGAMGYLIYILRIDVFLSTSSVYSQSTAYMLLLPCAVMVLVLIDTFDLKSLLFLMFGLFMMLSSGARGPIFCMTVLFAAKILLQTIRKEKRSKKVFKVIFVLFIGIIAVLLFLYFNEIVHNLFSIFERLNLSTRALSRILDGTFLEDQNRAMLAEAAMASIKAHLLTGIGVMNDRQYLYIATAMSDSAIGLYPHNIVLEMFMQFGVIIGSILLVFLANLLIKSLKRLKQCGINYDVLFLFITIGLIPLLVSGSYVDSSEFYALLGICTAILRLKSQGISMRNESMGEREV